MYKRFFSSVSNENTKASYNNEGIKTSDGLIYKRENPKYDLWKKFYTEFPEDLRKRSPSDSKQAEFLQLVNAEKRKVLRFQVKWSAIVTITAVLVGFGWYMPVFDNKKEDE